MEMFFPSSTHGCQRGLVAILGRLNGISAMRSAAGLMILAHVTVLAIERPLGTHFGLIWLLRLFRARSIGIHVAQHRRTMFSWPSRSIPDRRIVILWGAKGLKGGTSKTRTATVYVTMSLF